MVDNRAFHVSIKGLVYFEGKLLLLKRSPRTSTEYGFWELPGGGLDFGETPEEALRREMLEEVGLSVKSLKPILTWGFVKNENTQVVGITFSCESETDSPKLSFEHDDFKWVSPEELIGMKLLPPLKEDLIRLQLL